MSPSRATRRVATILLACCLVATSARSVIHLDSGDPTVGTTTPGDNSGWQYIGTWGGFTGMPIAPHFFVSAAHIGQQSGFFIFHGVSYTVAESHSDPTGSDLLLWRVQEAFPVYAPLFLTDGAEVGQELHVFGRGTQRGDPIMLNGDPRGWGWGAGDGLLRWGRNIVTANVTLGGQPFLQSAFDNPGPPLEAHLSAGDSGGAVFILQNGLWSLAGVNNGVDEVFTAPDAEHGLAGAIFNTQGYYNENDDGTFTQIDQPIPTSFYASQISAHFQWIQDTVGTDADLMTLPTENFSQWVQAYFTPDQIADPTIGGPNADPDGDGISNLLEFAFNLDPTFPEPVVMAAGTGVRGLPLIQLETVAPGEQRLTVEFVRRTAASSSSVTCVAQFTDAPGTGWQTGGTEGVTAINARWERVKTTDTVALGPGVAARFARVLVTAGAGNVGLSAGASAKSVRTPMSRAAVPAAPPAK